MFAPRKANFALQIGISVFIVIIAIFVGYLLNSFGFLRKNMNALHLGSDQVVYFPFVSKFDIPKDPSKTSLGLGFVEKLSADLSSRAVAFQKCRQFFLASSQVARFRVTIVSDLEKLQVRSLMEGADSNGPHAVCLRDVLEDLKFPSLAKATRIPEEDYVLVIDIQPRVSAPQPHSN